VAATESLRTARSALNVLQEHLGRTINDYAIWDESMQHLHVSFDLEWAAQNVGRYVASDYDIHTVLVISPGNQVVFAYETDGPTATPPRFEDIDQHFSALSQSPEQRIPTSPKSPASSVITDTPTSPRRVSSTGTTTIVRSRSILPPCWCSHATSSRS
jgi:sensor domain CHASE-containing protein